MCTTVFALLTAIKQGERYSNLAEIKLKNIPQTFFGGTFRIRTTNVQSQANFTS